MPDQPYLVAARKYRPALFNQLVAQEHVTETLKNAIRLDRLAHAYLFSGPRGVGKTTAARILAKAINCETPKSEREDEAEPCCECPSCKSFEEGRNLNIFELDAASNNKVDDIRELREKVRVPPQGNKKKVYIIDEVHMLSNQAFNALLKTLEEPPEHVLFIFATTEPNKVLPTILSRCQRFDFRRIPTGPIVEQLRYICDEEGITADESALTLIARKGNGALRDALSAFDQAVSLCGNELHHEELVQALGVVNVDRYFEATEHIANRDTAGMLRLAEHVAGAGHDLQEFMAGLAEHLRNLLVALSMNDADLIDATDTLRQRYLDHAEVFSEQDVLRFLTIAGEAQDELRESRQPRLKLEMALLTMTQLAHTADLRSAIAKIERLENMVQEDRLADLGISDSDNASSPPGRTSASSAPSSLTYEASSSNAPAVNEPNASSEDDENVETKQQKEESTSTSEEENEAEGDSPPSFAPPDSASEPSSSSTSPSESSRKSSGSSSYNDLFNKPALDDQGPPDHGGNDEASDEDAPQAQYRGDGAAVATAATDPQTDDLLAGVEAAWPDFVSTIRQERIHVGALLDHAVPSHVQSDTLTIAVPDDFHRRLLRGQHSYLIKHFHRIVTDKLERLDFIAQKFEVSSSEQETADEMDPYEYMQKKREESPVVNAIFEKFGGELVW